MESRFIRYSYSMTTDIGAIGLRLVRVLVYASLPLFLLFAGVDELNPGGVRAYEYSLDRRSPDISQLFPEQRLTAILEGSQKVRTEPVYFTVRYPVPYRRADVRIEVDNPQRLVWQIGIERGTGNGWAYDLVKPAPRGEASFRLADARIMNRRLRFIISVQGLTPTTTFGVEHISVMLNRHD